HKTIRQRRNPWCNTAPDVKLRHGHSDGEATTTAHRRSMEPARWKPEQESSQFSGGARSADPAERPAFGDKADGRRRGTRLSSKAPEQWPSRSAAGCRACSLNGAGSVGAGTGAIQDMLQMIYGWPQWSRLGGSRNRSPGLGAKSFNPVRGVLWG